MEQEQRRGTTTQRDGSREQSIIDQYEEWDPAAESVTALVERIGISRQRLYQVLDKHGIVPKSKRGHELADAVNAASHMVEVPMGNITLRIIVEVASDAARVAGF